MAVVGIIFLLLSEPPPVVWAVGGPEQKLVNINVRGIVRLTVDCTSAGWKLILELGIS